MNLHFQRTKINSRDICVVTAYFKRNFLEKSGKLKEMSDSKETY